MTYIKWFIKGQTQQVDKTKVSKVKKKKVIQDTSSEEELDSETEDEMSHDDDKVEDMNGTEDETIERKSEKPQVDEKITYFKYECR